MNFKKWLEGQGDNALIPSMPNDPEMNGLSRPLGYVAPRLRRHNSKSSLRIDKSFLGSRVREANEKEQDHGGCMFFTDGKKVLLLKRSPYAEHAPGKWGLVCGHSIGEETPLATARREAGEEIGKVQGERIGTLGENNKYPVHIFKVKTPFECKLNDENDEWEWVRFEDLDDYDLHPLFKRSMDSYIEFIKNNSKI